MLRRLIAALGVLLLLAAAGGGWLYFQSHLEVDGTSFVPPGSVDVRLDAGDYDILIDGRTYDDQCDPADYRGDVRQMRLELVAKDGTALKPILRDTCSATGDVDGAVSQFRVEKAGDYELRGAKELAAPGGAGKVYLADEGDRGTYLIVAIAGLILGVIVLTQLPAKRQRRPAPGTTGIV